MGGPLLAALFLAPASTKPAALASLPPLLKPELLGDESYGESFVAFADLEDGTYVKAQLAISNVGPGDGRAACRILVAGPGRPALTAGTVVDRAAWRHKDSPSPRLTVGACWIVAKEHLTFHAEGEGIQLNIRLNASPAKVRARTDTVKVKDAFYELEVLVPWAKAEVRLTTPGKEARKLKGYGYADHSRSTVLPGKLARQWVRFRAVQSQDSKLFLIRFPPHARRATGWHWAEGATGRVSVARARTQSRKSKDGTRGWRVLVNTEGGGAWRLTSKKLLYRYAPVEERGLLGSIVGTLIGNPVTYTYTGVLEQKKSATKIRGIFEITLADESK